MNCLQVFLPVSLIISLVSYYLFVALYEEPHIVHNYSKYHYFTLKFNTLPTKETTKLFTDYYKLTDLGQIGKLEQYRLFRIKKARFKSLNVEEFAKHIENYSLLNKEKFRSKSGPFNKLLKRFLVSEDTNDKEKTYSVLESVEYTKPRKLHKKGIVNPNRFPKAKQYNSTRFESLNIKDPGFERQWHLNNINTPGNDLNLVDLWEKGITGEGTVVALLDDGIDYMHKDIKDNFYLEGSYDFNYKKKLPMPTLSDDTHGTRCAGQIVAQRNDYCGVGIAYNAKVSGLRILSKEISPEDEAVAINYDFTNNHIFSCSWGPPDDGKAMDSAPKIVNDAIYNGIVNGRGKLGNIFVFASGNGGLYDDNCNFDGYTNSIYSITVGAINEFNEHASYSEGCTAVMTVAYSSGNIGRSIFTTTPWHNQCTNTHGGTSAAAPLAAGVIALAHSIRPDLHWRDFQYITMDSAIPININDGTWDKTASGKLYSSIYGYGKIDGENFVKHTKNFTSVGPQTVINSPVIEVQKKIPEGKNYKIKSYFEVTPEMLRNNKFNSTEHITVTVNIDHDTRSDVEVSLISPNNILSVICKPRSQDYSSAGFRDWTFSSVKHFRENPLGNWTIMVRDINKNELIGKFYNWKMSLWGEMGVKHEPTVPSEPSKLKAPPPPIFIPKYTKWTLYVENRKLNSSYLVFAHYFFGVSMITIMISLSIYSLVNCTRTSTIDHQEIGTQEKEEDDNEVVRDQQENMFLVSDPDEDENIEDVIVSDIPLIEKSQPSISSAEESTETSRLDSIRHQNTTSL